MRKRLLMLVAIVFALSLAAFPQGPQSTPNTSNSVASEPAPPRGKQTVEHICAYWVEVFKKDPPGRIEVFHVGGQRTVMGQENYVIGLTEAAFETGHPIYFTQGTEDLTSDGTIGKPVDEKVEK